MQILILLMFVSLMFFAAAALGFAYSVRSREAAHSDRLATLACQPDDSKEPL